MLKIVQQVTNFGQTIVQVILTRGYMSNCWSHGSDGSADNYVGQSFVGGIYNQQVIVRRTFTVKVKPQGGSLEIRINGVSESGQITQRFNIVHILKYEIANGLYS